MSKLDLTAARRIKGPMGEALELKGPGYAWRRGALEDLYGIGAGRIAIHHSTLGAHPVNGATAGLKNFGGAEAYFDAHTTGNPHPVEGNFLRFTPANGNMTMAAPCDLQGVHLMFVLDGAATRNGTRLFGSPTTQIAISANSTQWRLNVAASGANLAGPLINRTDGPQLCEITIRGESVIHYLNGALNRTGVIAGVSAGFPLIDIGRGADADRPLNGLMGDVLGVTLGAGADAAVARAMDYLNVRFGMTWARA